VWKAKLRAEASMVRAGKIVGLVECNIFDEQRRLVARASSTCIRCAANSRQAASHRREPTRSPELRMDSIFNVRQN
jgi:hypothetical protein